MGNILLNSAALASYPGFSEVFTVVASNLSTQIHKSQLTVDCL